MREVAPSHEVVRFSAFEVDFRNGEIRKDGSRVRLQDQPFRILQILLEHPGELVTREDLQRQIWPADTFVDFEKGLNNAIKRLRDALGDSAEQPRFIETHPKRGYRFIGSVTATNGAGQTQEGPATGDVVVPARPRQLYRRLAIGVLILAFVVILFALDIGGLRKRFLIKPSSPVIHSLAVIPLTNLSNDPNQEYFSDGMTDALITDLAQIGSLKVISRTSTIGYKGSKKTLPEIARELNVDGIVEGTVQRSGDRVRITAQLIYAPLDKNVWANSYERDMRDVFALERDVTGDIVRQVQARVATTNRPPNAEVHVTNPKALEAYLRGHYYVTRGDWSVSDDEIGKAAGYFQQAIDADPDFVRAYLGLADAHAGLLLGSREDIAVRRKAAEKVLGLDPNSSEARAILADIKWNDFDWEGGEKEYRQATALNSNSVSAHEGLGTVLAATGRLDEGLREVEIAQGLDPNDDHLSAILEMRGEHERAIEVLQRMVDLHPDDGVNPYALYRIYAESGRYQEAIRELTQACTLFGWSEIAANLHHAFTVSGYQGAMREWAKQLEHLHATDKAFLPENLAYAYLASGDKDRAFYWLEQAYEHREKVSHDYGLTILKADHLFDSLHSDPRYVDLLRRIGLTP